MAELYIAWDCPLNPWDPNSKRNKDRMRADLTHLTPEQGLAHCHRVADRLNGIYGRGTHWVEDGKGTIIDKEPEKENDQ